jgi:hypothetical protein
MTMEEEMRRQIKILQMQENMSYQEAKKRIENKFDAIARIA